MVRAPVRAAAGRLGRAWRRQLTPHLVAHGQIVGHEACRCLWWALGLWLAVTTFDRTGAETETGTETETEAGTETETETETETVAARLPLRLVGLGVVLGLAIGSRFVSGLLAPLLGATLLIMSPRGQRLRTTLLGLAIMPATAIATLIAVWPRLWSSPLVHLGESWAKLSKPHGQEPWLGEMTNQPSPVYFIIYLVATAPLGILIGAALWKARTFVDLRAGAGAWARAGGRRRGAGLLVLAPLGHDGLAGAARRRALRVAVGAGAGADERGRRRRPGHLADRASAPTRARGFAIAGRARLRRVPRRHGGRSIHPYYLDYYGEQVGGTERRVQARRFETAWWGEGLDRAVAYVNAHARPTAVVHRECIEPGQAPRPGSAATCGRR
jgi:hypothetical protein